MTVLRVLPIGDTCLGSLEPALLTRKAPSAAYAAGPHTMKLRPMFVQSSADSSAMDS